MLPLVAVALLFQITPAQRARVAWVPNPRPANSWVADPAHHLQAATVSGANSVIAALEQSTSAEIAVVVVDSTSGLEPQEFATTLHRAWGVGKSGKDNGVLFLWVPAQRKVFISVGYGLEGAIPDRKAGRIRDDSILPAFRAGHFDEGVLAGIRALAAAAREETGQRVGITQTMQGARPSAGRSSGSTFVLGAVALGILGLFILWFRRRQKPQLCPKGHGQMRMLGAEETAAKLDAGQKLEQELKSVDWHAWVCATCGETTLVPHRHVFSRFEDCPQCKRRTVESHTTVIQAATPVSGGLESITKTCKNCAWTQTTERSTPPTPIAVSSGGSSSGGGGGGGGGGGSFGGGSAGGGGAGGSY